MGSNTIRLLVARTDGRTVERVMDLSEFVRLGKDVDRTGRLSDDRMDAGVQTIERFVSAAREQGAEEVHGIATSAVRDAENGPEFVKRVRHETGLDIQIISGDREAELTFRGATIDTPLEGGVLVCDLGGGSAELISADQTGIRWKRSEALGSGRLTERFVHHDPPDAAELDALAADVRTVLASLPPAEPRTAVMTGGTASHVAALLGHRDGDAVTLEPAVLKEAVGILTDLPAASVAEKYAFRPERAEVLPAGAKTLQAIAEYYAVRHVLISRRGIREGAILDLGG